MNTHEKINYVEFPSLDIEVAKHFFTEVFSWKFTDYGPDYTAFSDEGLDGGFFKSEQHSSCTNGAALVIFYSNDLNETLDKIVKAKGKIIKDIFPFPGGSRFHFSDPNGNEYAVWSDVRVEN